MHDFIICGGTLVDRLSLRKNNCIAVSDGKISLIDSSCQHNARECINAHGLFISPGLIDLHVHGGNGADSFDCSHDSIDRISVFHGERGTTGLILSLGASSFERTALALERAACVRGMESGAAIIGFHLEGPFLNPCFCGALDSSHFLMPDSKAAGELLAAGRGNIKIVTVAPELPGCLQLIEFLSSSGIVVSIGHSAASFEETLRAKAAGLRHVTHIFNAMRGMHHREPGPAGAALSSEDLSVEVIADGLHVHRFFLKLLWQTKERNLALVSDCIAAAGMPDGQYRLAGRQISLKGGRAIAGDGILAGSTATLLDCVKTMVLSGLSIPQAIYFATENPARILSLNRKGRLSPGFDADIMIFDPDLTPRLVVAGGRIIYRKNI